MSIAHSSKIAATFTMLVISLLASVGFAQSPSTAPKDVSNPSAPVIPNAPPPELRTSPGTVKTARVYFIQPKDGDTIGKTSTFKFAVEGLKVAPAGEITPGSGHFHIIIDAPIVKEGEIVPSDAKHIHYGKGQIEDRITLTPGEHTITLQFADGVHRAYTLMLAQTIKVRVK